MKALHKPKKMEQPIEQLQAQIAFLQSEKALHEGQIAVLNEKLKKVFLEENTDDADFSNQLYQVETLMYDVKKKKEHLVFFGQRILHFKSRMLELKK